MTEIEIVKARQDLKELVDKYATESDRNNQDYYVNVFTEDCHVRVTRALVRQKSLFT